MEARDGAFEPMSRASLLAAVQRYIGQPTNDCIDLIKDIAELNRYSVLILDPVFDPKSIMADSSRLNVRQDEAGNIVSFSIG